MASLNQCNFIGNVGKIESRHMNNGDQVVNLSIACNENYKDKNGEKQEKTEWVNVTVYGKLAEITAQYVNKGMQIYISGRMATRKYTDKQGIERYTTEIIANEMKMLGSKSGSVSESSQQSQAPAQNKTGFDIENDLPF
jgi:single-strand DNA-binding protein